ncbi:hypothetical protein [Xanthomonas maliensis]|uniref:hypothetical protein n=1 Tax=Xanthomonas maliensis TaxID=1321368 RepID=UPI00039AECB6|nr:hypothetical protein [Xanthomonas maliensis]KAB7768832.1 hypothetical protein CKY51_08710 [Xanthomonas maliensis]
MRFADFQQALQAQFGEEAAAARHEIYFLSRRRGAWLRAAMAMLRDVWLCLRLPAEAPAVHAWTALATLPGSNGWGALAPYVADLQRQGTACTVLIHPRLRGQVAGQVPARPAWSAWLAAANALRVRRSTTGAAIASPWVVRACVFRQRLWRGAFQRMLRSPPSGATLLLHNDFDMYASAALQATDACWRSVCVQHGLPTDEFFPVRARHHLLWGASSAQVYRDHGVAPAAIGYGPPVAITEVDTASTPAILYVMSQSHTPIYGIALAPHLLALARTLLEVESMGMAVRILLHPEEVRSGHPYREPALQQRCQLPPHPLLGSTAQPAVLVGFCSTALLQAACRGHYVIGMAWPASASQEALMVGRPEHQVADAAALIQAIQMLRNDPAARHRFAAQQRQWLQRTFDHDAQWSQQLVAAP